MGVWWADLEDSVLTETAWERQMSLSGIEKFERARLNKKGEQKAASDSSAGQKMLKRMVEQAALLIEAAQREVVASGKQTGTTARTAKAAVVSLPADTAALLVLRAIIDKTYAAANATDGCNYQILVKEVSRAVELELNFRNWVMKSKSAAVAYAKAEGLSKTPKSYAERLIEEEGLTPRSLSRWRKAFTELHEYEWSTLEKHYCGDVLVSAVVNGMPSAFEFHKLFKGERAEKTVRMTPTFREAFDTMEGRVADMQVVKKPMITRPRPWKKC